MTGESRVAIAADADIVAARRSGRSLATELGFGSADATLVATAISELARNILVYAKRGEILVRPDQSGVRVGILVIARDDGPGISNVDRAMQDGFSTGNGLGLGLPGARRMMDEFEIASTPGAGTTVTMRKWLPQRR